MQRQCHGERPIGGANQGTSGGRATPVRLSQSFASDYLSAADRAVCDSRSADGDPNGSRTDTFLEGDQPWPPRRAARKRALPALAANSSFPPTARSSSLVAS